MIARVLRVLKILRVALRYGLDEIILSGEIGRAHV